MNGKIFGNSLVKFGFVAFALALGLAACGGDNGANGANGTDGKDGVSGTDGKDGANGKDGTSCELKIAKDSSYYEITCGDKTISVPLNGNSGQNVGTNNGVGVNPDDAYLTFDRRVYVGDNSAAKITMKNEALKGDSVVVKFCASECKNIALRKDKDVFTKTIYLNGTENQKDNFAVIENDKVKVNYADLDVSLADSATWLLKAQGYVQFGQDVYTTPFTQPTVYLYDDDNLNDFAYVTVSSSKNKEGIKVKLSRYSDYFYGTFEMSVAGGSSNVLEIENGKKIGVAYYDSSMAATQIDSATINFPENTYNATLSFGDTRYNGYEDKAVINLTDYFLTTQVPVKVNVWSDSDVEGCEVDLFPTSGGLVGYMRIGYVEFVSKKTDKACALVVSEGDNIYAEYESAYGNKTVKATATWGKADAAKSSSSSVPGSSSSVIPGTDPGSPVFGTLTDTRDGQVYKTIKIGTQTWMAENLNYNPGDVSSMGSYAWSGCYGNESSNCTKYGRLYTWEVAMYNADCAFGKECNASLNSTTPVRGVCPQGWHLPSHYEFEELINYIDPTFKYNHTDDASSSTAGQYLKSKSGWNSNGNGTDASGFSALPGGSRYGGGYFGGAGDYAYFWSSGEGYSSNAFGLDLYYGSENASLYYYGKDYASRFAVSRTKAMVSVAQACLPV